jgi:hypothetical protein
MPTFIDESGDTGPIEAGGTPYFRLAAVWIPSLAEVEEFRSKIRQLRLDLGLPQAFEFKYSKTHRNPELRTAFFRTALAQEFRFAFSSIDKTQSEWASSQREEQHWACVTDLAVNLRSVYHRAEEGSSQPLRELMVVDNNADREFLDLVKKQFRGLKSKNRPTSSMFGKVNFRDSNSDEALQLVDMICGSVGSMLDGNDRSCYDLISLRMLNPS